MRTRTILTVLTSLSIAVAGCSSVGSGANTGPSTDKLIVALGAEAPALDPHIIDAAPLRQILNDNVFEGLVKWSTGEDPELIPALATEWTQTTPTTWTFTLEEGVEFQNGEPFDAEAAAYSLNRVRDPANNSQLATYLGTVTNVTADGEYDLVIETDGPDPILPRRLTWIMMVPPELTKTGSEALAENPAGTGPYQVSKQDSVGVELSTWPDYRGDVPADAIENIQFITREDDAARTALLRANEAHLVFNLPLEADDSVSEVTTIPGLEVSALRLNTLGKLTQDIRVREAIAKAINVADLREGLLGEFGRGTNGQIMVEGVDGFNPDLEDYEFDPEGARDLIEQAGASGKTIKLIGVAGRYVKGKEAAEAVAGALEEVGFTVDLDVVDFQTWIDIVLNPSPDSPEIVYAGPGSDAYLDGSQCFDVFVAKEGSASLFPGAEFPDAQAKLTAAAKETDPATRTQYLEDISEQVHESYAMVPLFSFDLLWGTNGVTFEPRRDNTIPMLTVRFKNG